MIESSITEEIREENASEKSSSEKDEASTRAKKVLLAVNSQNDDHVIVREGASMF